MYSYLRDTTLAVILMGPALMFSACGKAKEEADAALKAAEKAITEVKADAAKFVPDQLKGLEAALNSAKEKFNKGDYKEVLAEAQAIPAKAKEVMAAANAKKEELTKAWTNLSQEVPKLLEAIKSRIDNISKSKRLPKKITKEKFEEAKSGLDMILKSWAQAEDASRAETLQRRSPRPILSRKRLLSSYKAWMCRRRGPQSKREELRSKRFVLVGFWSLVGSDQGN